MRRFHQPAVVVGLLAAVLLCAGCHDDDFWVPDLRETTLTGHVTDQESGDPIDGARVAVDGRSDTTNDDGYYRIDDLDDREYVVEVSCPGYESLSRLVDLDDVVEVEDFALRPL